MTRIDGLNSISTSRTLGGHGASGIESGESGRPGEANRAGGRQDVLCSL